MKLYHEIEVTLHPSLRVEIQTHCSRIRIYEKRLQLHVFEALS